MKILKKALLYDISNMAYTIADNGEPLNHGLHRVRDICQDGNIDRVSRVLGLAYSQVLSVLLPLLTPQKLNIEKDLSARPHDYEFHFRKDRNLRFRLTKEHQLKIKETVHEFMVCKVLADWLAVTMPEAADVWKFRADACLEALGEMVAGLVSSSAMGFRRKLSPF